MSAVDSHKEVEPVDVSHVELVKPEWTRVTHDSVPGSEGPVFDGRGRFFVVAPEREVDAAPAGHVLELDTTSGKTRVHAAPVIDGYGGIPAGCQADKANNLWVADMRLGLLKVAPDGAVTQVSRICDGVVMQGCNDCAFDSKGNLFVTAPAGPIAPAAYTRSMQEPFGSVYCFPAVAESTVSGEFAQVPVHRILTGYRFPNGLAITKDDATLIVAETPTKSLWAFDIISPSHVRNRRLWARLPGDHDGGPDGMDFDDAGNLLVANWGGSHIEVYNPAGTQIARIKCPFANPSNVHFEPGTNTVYVTEHEFHSVWKFAWRATGLPQYAFRAPPLD